MTAELRPLTANDAPQLADFLTRHWGAPFVVARGRRYDARNLHGWIAEADGLWHGVLTCSDDPNGRQIVTLDSVEPGRGIGTALVDAARAGQRRVWLVTTNDNLEALRFWQRRGFRICAVHAGAVDAARAMKPAIPLIGHHGIVIHDEIELQWTPRLPASHRSTTWC
jgi:GNAT superfamily N-acetyltransferase